MSRSQDHRDSGQFDAAIRDRFGGYNSFSPRVAEVTQADLRDLTHPDELRALIDAIVADADWLQSIALRSYPHALGFDKIVLSSALPLGQLRLHVWWPKEHRIVEHIHNHRFWFSSIVIAGRIRNSTFAVDANFIDRGDKFSAYEESADTAEQMWSFRPAGTAELSLGTSADLPLNTSYTMSADVPHQIAALEPFTATVLFESTMKKQHSTIFLPSGSEPPKAAPQRRFSAITLREKLVKFATALS